MVEATQFLLESESGVHSGTPKGIWKANNGPLQTRRREVDKLYDQYHASYCAAIGLVDYVFMEQLQSCPAMLPRPRLHALLLERL